MKSSFSEKLPKPKFSEEGEKRIQGSVDHCGVDWFSGSVNYQIPLILTSARGLEPELILKYHANTQNGIVGLEFDRMPPIIPSN